MGRGCLALVLHAHLPFARHPEEEFSHQERWLFEAITESYVPLLQTLRRLSAESVPLKLTLSVSPTLASMWSDELLLARYKRHLDHLIALGEKECRRNRADADLLLLSQFYRDVFSETRRLFVEEWNCDLLGVVRRLRDDGALELMASGATHAVIPLHAPAAARAQIAVGCDFFREMFAEEPPGFWLPECAYTPAVDELLQAQNLRWFILDAHALHAAQPPARRGTSAPCFTPAGPAAFARDVEASAQIWNAEHGYPGDPVYRDFYRDIGFDLTREELHPLSYAHRSFTGIKYHRVTGRNLAKELYAPAAAEERARNHASHFVELCLQRLKDCDDFDSIIVAPFDAELFGHWWFEGPIFLEHVIRAAAGNGLPLITPGDFLRTHRTLQVVRPASSSWGDGGHLDVWLDEKCGWIYPHLHAATQRMLTLADLHAPDVSPEYDRALRQLGRELLLAQASDWPFHIRNGTAIDYATQRVRDHLERFSRLAASLEKRQVDTDFLAQCEERDNLFPEIEWRHFANLSFRAKSRNL